MTEQQRQNWNKSYCNTHIEYRGRAVGGDRGFNEPNPSTQASLFTSVSVESSPLSYLFTSATGCSKGWHKTLIRCMTLHFLYRRGAASLRYRNRAEVTVLMCQPKHYPVWFSCRRDRYPILKCKQNLSLDFQEELARLISRIPILA